MEQTMNGNELQFFKIMFGDLNAEKLRIPPDFRKHIQKDLSDKATLEGPSGDCRSVRVDTCAREIYLSDRWPQFVRENSLGNNEFLVFRYEGKMHFKVQIFNPNGCKRMDSAIELLKYDSSNKKRKRSRPRKTSESSPRKDSTGDHSRSGSIKFPKVQTGTGARKKAKRKTWDRPILEQNGSQMTTHANQMDLDLGTDDIPRNKILTEEEKRVWIEAKSFTSSNPCGLYWLSPKMRVMRFRLAFSRSYLPRTKTMMTLCTPEGQTWKTNYLPERSFLSGGWIRFVRTNNVGEGTLCVFELVGSKEFLVHIFRPH